jgi:hypothetical protein
VAVADPASRVRIVLTLRADFYDRPLIYPRFGELLGRNTEVVTPLAPDELDRPKQVEQRIARCVAALAEGPR